MEFETLTVRDPRYPARILDRLKDEAPTLHFHGPLQLLDRFTMAVIAADLTPAPAQLATNDLLFKIREYGINYIGGWHAIWETEVFRLALDTPTDPERRRSVTIFTARGLTRENWDNFLGDRFGYKGPFTGFPQKEEFYRRAREEELLWLSITPPDQLRFERKNIILRNRVACALADVVFVLFAEKGTKTMSVVKSVLKTGVPMFTTQYSDDKETDVNKELFDLGLPSFRRKTVGAFLESLGARTDAEPPFEPKPVAAGMLAESPPVPLPRPRQQKLL
jgi:predicted Rossmann fold nucleotide-binding protein DprA/Smf involved in DNA uptake